VFSSVVNDEAGLLASAVVTGSPMCAES